MGAVRFAQRIGPVRDRPLDGNMSDFLVPVSADIRICSIASSAVVSVAPATL